MQARRIALPLAASLLLTLCSTGTGTLQFFDFRVVLSPGDMAVGYGRIENHTDERLHLDGIDSPDFEAVTMHETRESEGRMQMRPVKDLAIRPGSALSLEPGGLHLMLTGPRRRLTPGDLVHLTITLNNRPYELDIPIKERTP